MQLIKILMIILGVSILFPPFGFPNEAERELPTVGMKWFDLLVVRPLSIVGSTVTTAFYVITVPVTFPSGLSEPAARIFVEAPWRFTGMRYLGDFKHYKDGHPMIILPEE